MTLYRNSYEKWQDRQMDIALIIASKPTYAYTFSTYRSLSRDVMGRLLGIYEERMNTFLAREKPTELMAPLKWIHAYEYESGNSHSHSVVNVPRRYRNRFVGYSVELWLNILSEYTGTLQKQIHTTKVKNKPSRRHKKLWIDSLYKKHYRYTTATATYMTKTGQLMLSTM